MVERTWSYRLLKTLEKDINLIASKILQSKLNNISGIKAYLTRSDDIYINLHDRYKIANQLKADILSLFIQIPQNLNL